MTDIINNILESNISVVSCYYKLSSKHSHDNYDIWINNLLKNTKMNIIIFTSNDLIDYFSKFKEFNKNIKLIIKEFDDLDILKKYNYKFWEYQRTLDPTPLVRTKECYIIWNSKMNFIKEAIEFNPFNSDKFIWNDIGSMRDINFSQKIIKYPIYNNVSNNKLDIILINKYNNIQQEYFQNEVHLSGSIFGSSRDVFLKIIDLYYKYFNEYVNQNLFIGCDQQILSTLYIKNKELFNLISPNNNNIDKWFYLYYHYIL